MVNVLIARGTKFATELTDFWLPANTQDEITAAEAVLCPR